LPKWKLAIEEPDPEELALRNLVIKPFDEELPSDEPSAFLIPVCRLSTDDEPFAESLALLIDVLICVTDEPDVADAFALLGEVCNGVEELPPFPISIAESNTVRSWVTLLSDVPSALAFLIPVCKVNAESPAVAPPEACPVRMLLCNVELLDVPEPEPEAFLICE
jgi:hypothetical protein